MFLYSNRFVDHHQHLVVVVLDQLAASNKENDDDVFCAEESSQTPLEETFSSVEYVCQNKIEQRIPFQKHPLTLEKSTRGNPVILLLPLLHLPHIHDYILRCQAGSQVKG